VLAVGEAQSDLEQLESTAFAAGYGEVPYHDTLLAKIGTLIDGAFVGWILESGVGVLEMRLYDPATTVELN
jgi:hypothetical protein